MARPIAEAHVRCAYCNRRIRISMGTARRIADDEVFVVCADCCLIAEGDGWVLVCPCEICGALDGCTHEKQVG